MLFNSLHFLLFFPIVVFCYFLIPSRVRYLWLLAASYYFYMCWNAKYALLLLFSTLVTYLCSLGIQKARSAGGGRPALAPKALVVLSLVLNLSILFFFKYFNFTFDLLAGLFRIFRIELHVPAFDVLLPVGISFYIFQALGYTIDVYRGDIAAERNFFRYALFVSFFPQLVAGPIERSKNLLGQLAQPARFHYGRAREGFVIMLWGFFLKVVLADRIAIFVDYAYGNFRAVSGYHLIIATLLFAMQIYCDFYGYSVIAKGAAKVIGIELMDNFRAPYLSVSVTDFWRSWHISLTSWFKDYLYIPLGGSRRGKRRKDLNRMIVFLLSGLWHGADISFVVWGGLNGFYQIAGDALKPLRERFVRFFRLNPQSLAHKAARMFFTFVLIDFSWIFFRAATFGDALRILKRMLLPGSPSALFDGSLYQCGLSSPAFQLVLICIVIVLLADLCQKRGIVLHKVLLAQDGWCRCLVIALCICFIVLFGVWGPAYDQASFIYFQF